jgi:serine/threonine protein kinase
MLKPNEHLTEGHSRLSPRPCLRRMSPMSTDLPLRSSRLDGPRLLSDSGSMPGTLLRLWLRPPWDDYISVCSPNGETSIACRRGSYFQRAFIREFPSLGGLELLQSLSTIQHPNIASIYDVYCAENKIFTATEYMELSLTDLQFHSFPFQEWEIATIIFEVSIQ